MSNQLAGLAGRQLPPLRRRLATEPVAHHRSLKRMAPSSRHAALVAGVHALARPAEALRQRRLGLTNWRIAWFFFQTSPCQLHTSPQASSLPALVRGSLAACRYAVFVAWTSCPLRKCHPGTAAINPAIVHARRLASRSFFSKSRTQNNQAPAMLLRCIALDNQLAVATGWLHHSSGNIACPPLFFDKSAAQSAVIES